jgi:hypothetical protein
MCGTVAYLRRQSWNALFRRRCSLASSSWDWSRGSSSPTQLGQLRVQNTLDARDFTLVKHGFEDEAEAFLAEAPW